MKKIMNRGGIMTFESGDTNQGNLPYHGILLENILKNQVLIMQKLLEIEDRLKGIR